MKITARHQIIWPVLILLMIAIGVLIYIFKQQDIQNKDIQSAPKANIDEALQPPSYPVAVRLPNATPITPIDGDYSDDSHIWRLVNKSHPLSDINYRPEIIKPNVPTRTDKSLDEQSVRRDIASSVEQLFAAAKDAGFILQIGSGFRNAELQNMYYSNYSRVYGQAAADMFSAKPGFSEHQTGLVVDVSETSNHCYLQECFGDTKAGRWLAENAHLYGFILRYPQNKDGITDFSYEPWHFRFVGVPLATALYESGLTLDEAAGYLLVN